MKQYKRYLKPFFSLLILYLIVCGLLRLILLFNPIVQGHFSLVILLKIFVLGAASNFFIFFQVGLFLWLYLLFLSDTKYNRPYGIIIFCFWLIMLLYVTCFNTILDQYGSVLPLLATIALSWKILTFGLMLFFPRQRCRIRLAVYSFWVFVFVCLILLNGLSEYFFFNEFGVRYNFIAVDYLVYTNEVIGNIMESYPIIPLFSILGLVSLVITWIIVRRTRGYLDHLPGWKHKGLLLCIEVAFVLLGWWAIPALAQLEPSPNEFASELQADGVYKFYTAYTRNKLDYFRFYPTMSNREAFTVLSRFLPGIHDSSTQRSIVYPGNELHKNVVLITIESLSADYMAHYGNTDHLTPFLDSLADQGLFFTNLYAAGNRTVRGLEAVTLCLPPTPGESVIKRKNNNDKFTVGYLFERRGYAVKFFYGGYSYFDNMKDFYTGNGYSIIDRDSLSANEITFANVWGACDEDMAQKAIKVMNREASRGKPFFNHWMTVSNHRPFTYPAGKIDIAGDSKSRKGGVKYTDYALSRFFKMAEGQPWFSNTVFVIVADHCASSAGKTTLPMNKYRIPAIVYSRNFIKPQKITTLMSQIDLMPTVLGLLHFSYSSKFYGMDVLQPGYQPRAFIATYQDMGYIRNNILTVLSPVRQVKQYQLIPVLKKGVAAEFQDNYREVPLRSKRQDLIEEAIANYQSAAWLLSHQGYQK